MKKILTILAAALVAFSANAQELTNFAFGGRKVIVSPEVQNDSVTFRLKADYATHTALGCRDMTTNSI